MTFQTCLAVHRLTMDAVKHIIDSSPDALFVNSSGGDINAALCLLSYCKQQRTFVTIGGECSSAACYLLALPPEQIAVLRFSFGLQHMPRVLVDADNLEASYDGRLLSAAEQWRVDRPIYERVLQRSFIADEPLVLSCRDLKKIVLDGALADAYSFV